MPQTTTYIIRLRRGERKFVGFIGVSSDTVTPGEVPPDLREKGFTKATELIPSDQTLHAIMCVP